MLNPTAILVDAFVERLEEAYARTYGAEDKTLPGVATWAARMTLELIAGSDALYHDVEHTMMVTLVGQAIYRGHHHRLGGCTPRDWLDYTLALLCHDIGYVRGICRSDAGRRVATGRGDETILLDPGATDASLAPYHVDRGKQFIRERFSGNAFIDSERVAACIELTRFPVPADEDHADTTGFPGLVRAADLIGQLGDPRYYQKQAALYYELVETGTAARLGYRNADELRTNYPSFYWTQVRPYIGPALEDLRVTEEGRLWIAQLHGHVFAAEHRPELD